jgi:glycosyltransferase involved in cell wall biosynthesis
VDEKKLISVIVPCYNEQEVLPMFFKEIRKISAQMQEKYPETEFEFLFIDDGSKDSTLSILRAMRREESRVRYISFSRNFGKESGIYAGLSNAKGDYCVVMDADLQHPPKFLPTMYEAVRSGRYDCATTRRVSREGESKVRSWFARLFYKIMNKISQTEIVDGAQDFRFMTRQMVDAVLSMSEYNRFSKGIFSWVGFRVKYLEYENVERAAGTSAWSFWGLFRYSLEGILGFSTAPLTATAIIGLIACLFGLILLLFTVIKKLVVGGDPLGYATTTCCIIFFGGLQVFCTGILGLYLGKTYLEVKHRPVYLVRETDENAEQFEEPVEDENPEEMEKRLKMNAVKRLKLETETEKELDEIVTAAFTDDEPEKAAAAEPEREAEISAEEDASEDWEESLPYDDEADDGEIEYDEEEILEEAEAEYDEEESVEEAEAEYDEEENVKEAEAEYDEEETVEEAEAEYDEEETVEEAEAEYDEEESIEEAEAESDEEESIEEAEAESDEEETVEEAEAESDEDEADEDDEDAAAELEAALKAAPRAPKRTEKFEIKIDYDSIDFDEDDDYDGSEKPAPRAAKRPAQKAPAQKKKPAARPAAHFEDEAPQVSVKDKALDIWYAIKDKMLTLKDKISEKINQAANGKFDPDAIERELDPEAFDEDFVDDYDEYDGDDYDDYPEDDGYDDDLDPDYDEHADDDDYHGSHF